MENDIITIENIYSILNKELFQNTLPDCIITLQRKQNCNGYFHANKFEKKIDNKIISDEIALNPDHFDREDEKIFSTIAHEMVHLWQHHFGERKSRAVYHNKEWANKMESIGLIPSNTGLEGGKKTGQRMTHYINQNGLFKKVILSILQNYKIEWKSKIELKFKKEDKNKWICPECGQIARAKPTAEIMCGICNIKMVNE